MNIDQLFQEILNKFPQLNTNKFTRKELVERLKELYSVELSQAPRVAIIGPTGVGKSSTINALFGTKLPVSHTVATTKEPIEISISGQEIFGSSGSLILYDMPGIGEDIDTDEIYKIMYRDVIARCDVAVWMLNVERPIAYTQMIIRDVVTPSNKQLASRLVVGINKVDLIEPYNWDIPANLPSKEQQINLSERIKDVQNRLVKVCPGLTSERVVGFSAEKHYRLQNLFNAMLDACPPERAWVLSSRQNIASYWELVDPKLRQEVLARVQKALQ